MIYVPLYCSPTGLSQHLYLQLVCVPGSVSQHAVVRVAKVSRAGQAGPTPVAATGTAVLQKAQCASFPAGAALLAVSSFLRLQVTVFTV